MSAFNTLNTVTPYNENDDVLHLFLDADSDAYVLKDVIKLAGTYTFSIWHKADTDSQITFNLFGNTEQISSTSKWQKYIKTIKIASLDNTSIYIVPSLNTSTYFYEGFLSEGTLDVSWTPAPEDSDRNMLDVYSKIEQTADSIISKVEANDGRLSQLAIGLNGVLAHVETLGGNVGKLEVTANEVKAEVNDARGNSSSLAVRINGIESKVVDENGESIIEQTAEQILLSVEEKLANNRSMGIRYIRDWLNGGTDEFSNETDTISNKWVECQVLANEVDIASGIIPVCYDEHLAEVNIENLNPEVYTNEMLLEESNDVDNIAVIDDENITDSTAIPLNEQYIELNGHHCLQVDLGEVCYNIDSIRIWHYYLNETRYNHKLEVSSDGETWIILYDSDVSGSYVETEIGKIYHFSNSAINKSIAQIHMEQDEINLRVQNNANQFASLDLKADRINSTVGIIQDDQVKLNNSLQSNKKNLDDQIENIKQTYTTINQTKEMIEETVSDIDGKIQSQVSLTADGWKGKFAILGMMDEDDPELQNNTHTYVKMSANGLEVSSDDESRRRTLVTKDGFSGYYDDNEIFKLDDHGCWTGRVYINNGWETPGIKMIPIDYNHNNNVVKGVVYVKTGGAS